MKFILLISLLVLSACFNEPQVIALDVSSLKKIDLEFKRGNIVITKSLDKTELNCKKGGFTLDKSKNQLKTADKMIDCVLRINKANVSMTLDYANVTVDDIDGNVFIKGNTVDLYVFEDDLNEKMAFLFPLDRKYFFAQTFIDFFFKERQVDRSNIVIDAEEGNARLIPNDPKKRAKIMEHINKNK